MVSMIFLWCPARREKKKRTQKQNSNDNKKKPRTNCLMSMFGGLKKTQRKISRKSDKDRLQIIAYNGTLTEFILHLHFHYHSFIESSSLRWVLSGAWVMEAATGAYISTHVIQFESNRIQFAMHLHHQFRIGSAVLCYPHIYRFKCMLCRWSH